MAIDPEVTPFSSKEGITSLHFIPKWAIYVAIGLGVLIIISLLKILLPLIILSLVLSLVLKQAKIF